MTPRLPDGEAAPVDGVLPEAVLARLRVPKAFDGSDRFGAYVHVPYCATRCGYCDFNTYTPGELAGAPALTGFGQSDEVDSYLTALCAEIELAAQTIRGRTDAPLPTIDTLFIGGGTPTLLATEHLATILDRLDKVFGLSPRVEISTEANPESVTQESLAELVDAGFTRISLGMQSAVGHVLSVLDRQHTPGRAVLAAQQARKAGFSNVNL
ncbi:MAG: radical SAM protein, partial [Pseudonocardiaceae bacterium]